MEWTAATITMLIILTLALGRTIMDREWPKVIGVALLVVVIAIPIMLSKRTTITAERTPLATGSNDVQSAAVIVDTSFVPARVHFKAGSPAGLIFLRETGNDCNAAVVFPALNRTVELPIGERVEVEFSGSELLRLDFTCQQNKIRGVVEFST